MVEYNTCPICHNRISVNRFRGADGIDENGDPVPFWTDDPLLTKRGLAGDDYKGTTPSRQLIIKELQDYYNQIEEDIGLEQTNFTEVSKRAPFRRIHITELRSSIERILEVYGMSLADYFKYDRYGNDTGSTQIDWSDVDRTNDYPSILKEKPIRAIYIEELRHAIQIDISGLAILSDELWNWFGTHKMEIFGYHSVKYEGEHLFKDLKRESLDGISVSRKTADKNYFWLCDSTTIYGFSWRTTQTKNFDFGYYGYGFPLSIFSDGTYLWLITTHLPLEIIHLLKIRIETMQIEKVSLIPLPDSQYTIIPVVLSMDADYFYIMYRYEGTKGIGSSAHQRIEKVMKPIFQESVKDKDLSEPPISPSKGDRYLIIFGALGTLWSGHNNEIAQYNGATWDFYEPKKSWITRVEDENKDYIYDGDNWSIWEDKTLFLETYTNIPILHNDATTNTFPDDFWAVTLQPIKGYPFYNSGWYVWNYIEDSIPSFSINYEWWKFLNFDEEYIYLERLIVKDDYAPDTYRSIWGEAPIFGCVGYERKEDIIKISKEDLSLDKFIDMKDVYDKKTSIIDSQFHDLYKVIELFSKYEIRDFVADRNYIYVLYSDLTVLSERYTFISQVLLDVYSIDFTNIVKLGRITYPGIWAYPWIRYSIDNVIPMQEIAPKIYLKVFDKEGNLVREYDQKIGNSGEYIFYFDRYKQIFDDNNLNYLRFLLSMVTSDTLKFIQSSQE